LQMGADRIVSVAIPCQEGAGDYGNMFAVVSRCFQVMSARTENSWRRYSNVVIRPHCGALSWDSFASADRLIELGEEAAMAAMPAIKKWLKAPVADAHAPAPNPAHVAAEVRSL